MVLDSFNRRIYIAGHNGLVGSAITRCLREKGYSRLLLRSKVELDLTRQIDVERFFERERPEYVILAAARVGGILANDRYPAEFILDNLVIETNVIKAAHACGVKRLLFLGSSCIYPRLAPQPLREEYLLTGPLEQTNEWYAVAKIAGIKLCQAFRRQYGADFISAMPTNLYGPNDNFDLQSSHVLPALIRKFHDSLKEPGEPVLLWGTGTPRREFLYVDDLAEACHFLMTVPEERLHRVAPDGMVNIGMGSDLEIRELAEIIRDVVGSTSEIRYDTSKPDGTPRKLMDVTRMNTLGWQARTSLEQGIRKVYEWYRRQAAVD